MNEKPEIGNQWSVISRQGSVVRGLSAIACGLAKMGLLSAVCLSSAFAVDNNATFDGGGKRVTSASYIIDGSIGGIGGMASVGAQMARHGYIGQLTDVTNLVVWAAPAPVNETAGSQLYGTAELDDATVTVLPGSSINWNPPTFPLASISAAGVVTPSIVYQNTLGSFSGYYLDALGAGSLQVLDSDPDNYGLYAGDTVPDWWQVGYFGTSNPNGVAGADPDGDGQDNKFEYVANLVPTNSASMFLLRIEAMAGQPNRKNLIFSPRWTDRTYIPQFTTNLIVGTYGTLTSTSTSDVGNERTVTDLNAIEPTKSYRIMITYP